MELQRKTEERSYKEQEVEGKCSYEIRYLVKKQEISRKRNKQLEKGITGGIRNVQN